MKGIKALAFSPTFRKLIELDLTELSITNEAIIHLSNSHSKQSLRKLKLGTTLIDNSALSLIGSCSKFSRLESIEFSNLENIDIKTFGLFCNHNTHSLQLKSLVLKACNIKFEHIRLMSYADSLAKLEFLDLSGNALDDRITADFFRAKFQRTLKHLMFARNHISYKFLEHLTKSKCYSNFRNS